MVDVSKDKYISREVIRDEALSITVSETPQGEIMIDEEKINKTPNKVKPIKNIYHYCIFKGRSEVPHYVTKSFRINEGNRCL